MMLYDSRSNIQNRHTDEFCGPLTLKTSDWATSRAVFYIMKVFAISHTTELLYSTSDS